MNEAGTRAEHIDPALREQDLKFSVRNEDARVSQIDW